MTFRSAHHFLGTGSNESAEFAVSLLDQEISLGQPTFSAESLVEIHLIEEISARGGARSQIGGPSASDRH
jgi:hypothetical protein